ncbi:Auxin-induced protein [Macleaya cordata]|uniref:Auxin-induced protein n=1 Tax=Macleaya cordata TaxID=56857 RepID=A0A200R5S6_MACCD|nr:Auxin-induced protein [Macleaya cordata]
MGKSRFIRAYLNKWRKMGTKVFPPSSTSTNYDHCCLQCCCWALWRPNSCISLFHDQEEKIKEIPRDVPKGHLVVYVGEEYKRFVIKISILKHPLFKALLDRAREEYDFTHPYSKLCIPCEEKVFLSVIRCASTPEKPKILLCPGSS